MCNGAGIINWTKGELEKLDITTRKLRTGYGMFHPCSNVDRLYLPRENGGRGFIGAEECVRAEERGVAYYVETSTELLIAVRNEEGLNNVSEAPKAFREQKKIEILNE